MRVITLKQPWATLVAEGLKTYELRNMNYKYRGKILIHAGKGVDEKAMEIVKPLNLSYPSSQILAEVEIVDCIKIDKEFNNYLHKLDPLVYSNKPDRTGYAWKLDNIKKIENGIKINGKQGIWYIEKSDV